MEVAGESVAVWDILRWSVSCNEANVPIRTAPIALADTLAVPPSSGK